MHMYSLEHKKYLRKLKMNKVLVSVCQISIVTLFIIIWQILADYKLINTFISSSPKMVLKTLIELHQSGSIYRHIWVTVYETLISFSLGTFIGIIVATLLWRYDFLAKVLDPYLTIINSLPKVALGPIIIIWVGANINSIILMALLISVIITIVNIYQGFVNTEPLKIKLMNSFGANKKQIYFKLLLPNSFPTIISTLKINISMSLIGIIMGEFLVSKEGIGYLIMYGSQVFNLNLVITGIFVLCIVATILYYVVYYIEKRLIKN